MVGGGAAGLVAATCAAEAGASVVLLERDLECGRTILATGNGRCNFCNVDLDLRRYRHPDFVGQVFGERPLDEVLTFWRDCGLRWSLEEDRLYPLSRRAASVRNVLLARVRRSGAILAPARTVVSCKRVTDGFELGFSLEGSGAVQTLRARRVIWAAGGLHATVEADLSPLGLASTPGRPVLCPVSCKRDPLLELDGRRFHGAVSLIPQGSHFPCWRERGEVMLRDYGLSGIVVFDLSRRCAPGDAVELDMAPNLSRSELQALMDDRGKGTFRPGCLDGVLDPDLAALLERLSAGDPQRLIDLVKAYRLTVTGTVDAAHAQVMSGGLSVGGFTAQTLEAKSQPGFFACGEALDVDADCGGFNLAWTWKSAMVAGGAAARDL